MKGFKQWAIVAAVFFVAAIVNAQTVQPDWVNKPASKDTAEVKCFVGMSFQARSERTARQLAERDGLDKWASFFESAIKTRIVEDNKGGFDTEEIEEIFESDIKTRSAYTQAATANGKLVKAVEYYTKESKDSQQRTVYTVYALMEVSKAAVETILVDAGKKIEADLTKKPPKGLNNSELQEVLDFIHGGLVDNDEPIDFSNL